MVVHQNGGGDALLVDHDVRHSGFLYAREPAQLLGALATHSVEPPAAISVMKSVARATICRSCSCAQVYFSEIDPLGLRVYQATTAAAVGGNFFMSSCASNSTSPHCQSVASSVFIARALRKSQPSGLVTTLSEGFPC